MQAREQTNFGRPERIVIFVVFTITTTTTTLITNISTTIIATIFITGSMLGILFTFWGMGCRIFRKKVVLFSS